jgi:hypothetical protein
MPSEWLDVVWGGASPSFASNGEQEEILGAILVLYNEINACVMERRPGDACTAIPRLPPLSNFDPDAPLGQWSSGFALSQYWMRAEDSSLEDELKRVDKEIADNFMFSYMALSFFSSRGFAEEFFKETDEGELGELAGKFIKGFEDSLSVHVAVGLAFRGVDLEGDELGQEYGLKIGRNDPCPCGSGKKYKKCCGP